MDEQKITGGLLRMVMSEISDERWCASWLAGLEYILWEVAVGKRNDVCGPDEIEQLKYLSEKCGGWVVWNNQAIDQKFVPIEEWLRLCEANGHRYATA